MKNILFVYCLSMLLVACSSASKVSEKKQSVVRNTTNKNNSQTASKNKIDLEIEEAQFGILKQAYYATDFLSLERKLASFEKQFPNSVRLQEAYYMLGHVALNLKDYPHAIKAFNICIERFSNGSKTPSAYYGKALALKQMNLINLAKDVAAIMQKKYPKSLEAKKAVQEFRLIR